MVRGEVAGSKKWSGQRVKRLVEQEDRRATITGQDRIINSKERKRVDGRKGTVKKRQEALPECRK